MLECAERRDIEAARAVGLSRWSAQACREDTVTDLVKNLIKSGGFPFLELLEKAGFSIAEVIAEDEDGDTLKMALIYGEHEIARQLVLRGMKRDNLVPFVRWINDRPKNPLSDRYFPSLEDRVALNDWKTRITQNRGICFDMVTKNFEIPINLYCTREEFAAFPAK